MMRTVRRFTGYHATVILIAFFAIVIAVNVLMTTLAIGTFGGALVDNSYVASQKFNGWLKEARAEKKLGWLISPPERDGDQFLSLTISDSSGADLQGAKVEMRAEHPLGQAPARRVEFHAISRGLYRSAVSLPRGRWKLWLRVTHGKDHTDRSFEIQ